MSKSDALAKPLPSPGYVLVHNSRRMPNTRRGDRGIRFFCRMPSKKLALCDCRWRPDFGEHYRMRVIEMMEVRHRAVTVRRVAGCGESTSREAQGTKCRTAPFNLQSGTIRFDRLVRWPQMHRLEGTHP
jgi:hypothetical protein